MSREWRRGAGTGGGLGGMRSKGQVGLGGGRLDWGSKVVSALVVRPRVGRALPSVSRPSPPVRETLQYQQHAHTHTRLEILINKPLTYLSRQDMHFCNNWPAYTIRKAAATSVVNAL